MNFSNLTNFTWNGIVSTCQDLILEAQTQCVKYNADLSLKFKIVIIAMFVLITFLYVFIEKKLRTNKRNITQPKDYTDIIRVVHNLISIIMVGLLFSLIFLLGLW